jgi:hypothetical protein
MVTEIPNGLGFGYSISVALPPSMPEYARDAVLDLAAACERRSLIGTIGKRPERHRPLVNPGVPLPNYSLLY